MSPLWSTENRGRAGYNGTNITEFQNSVISPFGHCNIPAPQGTARQILDDPAGDHDWGISATVDLAASDEAGEAVVTVTGVDRL